MFDNLTESETAVLRQLADRGSPVAEATLDAEALRTLVLHRYIRRLSGFAVITPDGRRAVQELRQGRQPAPARGRGDAHPHVRVRTPEPAAAEEERDAPRVNTTQEDMIRRLVQAEAAVPFDDLDGRVVRALEGRGLVRKVDGLVELTDEGRAFYESNVRRRRRARSGWARNAVVAPAEGEERATREQSIREAVDALRRAIGGADAIEIGDLEASAEEAFNALLELADRIERGADPRRIGRR
ncbi:MAG TPA: hypothetical protein VNP72_02190 [Longimicrobium sp.]|nr:hypothetical protein [Longimicrobium sp.]